MADMTKDNIRTESLVNAVRAIRGSKPVTRLNQIRHALTGWHRLYVPARRYLQPPIVWSQPGETYVTNGARASLEWDAAHPVRYRLWRAYIGFAHPSRTARERLVRPIRRFVQRGRRGWCDEDAGVINGWLSGVLPDVLDRLRRNADGWPGEPMTFEQWAGDGGVIDQIAQGFRAAHAISKLDYGGPGESTYEELRSEFDHGFELLKRWYCALWG